MREPAKWVVSPSKSILHHLKAVTCSHKKHKHPVSGNCCSPSRNESFGGLPAVSSLLGLAKKVLYSFPVKKKTQEVGFAKSVAKTKARYWGTV